MEKLEKREKFKKTSKLFRLLEESDVLDIAKINSPLLLLSAYLTKNQVFDSMFIGEVVIFSCWGLFALNSVVLFLFKSKQEQLLKTKKQVIDNFIAENSNELESKITR